MERDCANQIISLIHMSFMKGVGAAILARWYRFGGGLLAGYGQIKEAVCMFTGN